MNCFCLRQANGVRKYSKTESHDFHCILKQTWVFELTGYKMQNIHVLTLIHFIIRIIKITCQTTMDFYRVKWNDAVVKHFVN